MSLNFKVNWQDIKWHQLKTGDFWFGIDRVTLHVSDKIFLLAGLVLIIIGIIFLAFARFTTNQFLAKVAVRFTKIFITISLLEGLWFFFRTQYAQMLGTKFMAVLILLIGLVWLYWPIKYLIVHYKVDMAEAARAASREKYLKRT